MEKVTIFIFLPFFTMNAFAHGDDGHLYSITYLECNLGECYDGDVFGGGRDDVVEQYVNITHGGIGECTVQYGEPWISLTGKGQYHAAADDVYFAFNKEYDAEGNHKRLADGIACNTRIVPEVSGSHYEGKVTKWYCADGYGPMTHFESGIYTIHECLAEVVEPPEPPGLNPKSSPSKC